MKLKPKFLTAEVAEKAVNIVWDAVRPKGTLDLKDFSPLNKAAGHIVILVPEMEVPSNDSDVCENGVHYPDYPIKPVVLFEQSFGDKEKEWTGDYIEIARCKALQLWHDRNDGRTDIVPHLLYSGDYRYYGGVKRDGIVAAFSGVQPWFDRMISGMVADMCIALAYDAWMNSTERNELRDMLF